MHVYRTANKIVVNFPTKRNWRHPSKPEYIEAGLKIFCEQYSDFGIGSVAFPQLGCGNGELDWESQVKPLMERYLKRLPIPVYIHLYRPADGFIPERFDKNFRKQVLLERVQISASEAWDDLQTLTRQHSLMPEDNLIRFSDEFVYLSTSIAEQNDFLVFRGDFDDLWNILRTRGTVNCQDLPPNIADTPAAAQLFDLLERLDYVRPITVQLANTNNSCRGLQYVPGPGSNEAIALEAIQ
jgi:hypothetical protein